MANLDYADCRLLWFSISVAIWAAYWLLPMGKLEVRGRELPGTLTSC